MKHFKEYSEEEKKEWTDIMFTPLNSADELRDWILTFLGLDMPIGHIDPDSTSSPVEAMWEIYETVKLNKGEENPGYIMLSAREGYKTLSASILETLLMVHFQVTIAHMAAIREQSAKSIQYINYFFGKIDPLLTCRGWVNTSQNKNKIEYRTEHGADVYIKVIVATLSGANSEHTNLMFIDEIDVVKDPMAYEEAKLIPGYAKGLHPVTVKLSTRKFAFGLMQKEIDLAPISGDKILRWNIMDVTERCAPQRHKPNQPRADRYVSKALPLRQISPEEFHDLQEADKDKWDLVANAYAGCADCKLLPVCKTKLADRPETDRGGLYKPVGAVINTFKKTNPDMAEAQLMCWKPSAKGMVYGRFEGTVNTGNVITLDRAFETLIGDPPKKKITQVDLIHTMKNLGIDFYAGVDWGYTHDFVIVIFAKIPNGEFWIVDCYSQSGLEFSDILETAIGYRDKYQPVKWYCDQAMPSHIKSFTKNGMKSPKFTKDVMGGIEALRAKIVGGTGKRLLKVLYTDDNQKIINSFQKHHFKLDAAGKPSLIPDDTAGVSDQADAMRYVAQNLFPLKGPQKPIAEWSEAELAKAKNPTAAEQMQQEIINRVEGGAGVTQGSGRKGGFYFNF